MALQLDEVLGEVGRESEAAIRDVPEFDGAILGGAGDDVVVKRVPSHVGYRSAMSRYLLKETCLLLIVYLKTSPPY